MSRTKVETVESENTEVLETKETKKPVEKTDTKKMGLEFYLQKNPQKYTIAQLMRTKYKNCVKTEKEWNETLAKLLGKKVIS